jgi:Predicted transcriptional regulator with C-terminal CBS domains
VTVSLPPNRVRLIRQALGISQAELARRVGVNASLLSRAERGEIRPWPRLRRATADALGVSETVLFGGER